MEKPVELLIYSIFIDGRLIYIEDEFTGHDGGKKIRKKYNRTIILFYRWVILLFIAILTLPEMNIHTQGYALLEALAAAAIYNGALTAFAAKNNKIPTSSVYIDIFLLTVLSFFSGGLDSEVYVFIFFLIGFCGISYDSMLTVRIGAFSAVFYMASSIFASHIGQQALSYPRLVIKALLFIICALGMSRINSEVRKYDELRRKEFKIARTDKLTGLANRHYFDQKLREEVEYADMNRSTLNVLIFDLDNFKGFNDTYGHMAGDKLLMLFSDIIRQCIRKQDIPVRYGGEEFLVLIRDLDIILAKSVGERIRRQLDKQRIYLGSQEEKKKITVSCGVAQYPKHSKNIREVVELADQALYHAKEIGKNIVVTYDEIGLGRESMGIV